MIVRRSESDYLLITQADHAALAERLAQAFRAEGFADRVKRARVLEATRLHDVGWGPVDAAPRMNPENGAPYDVINVPLDVRQGAWPRAVDELIPRDPYIAALVAHHAVTVYGRYSGTADWAAFFAEMARRRDELLTALDANRDEFLRDYAVLGYVDRWSLVFCYGWTELNRLGGYEAQLIDNTVLEISPDPFAGAALPLEVAARRIPSRRYGSDAELREAIAEAPLVWLSGVARGHAAG